MSRLNAIRYFDLWQVDPNTQGKEQERFFKLRTLLSEAAAYLCLPHRDDPFLSERMPFEKALELLTRAWGMKASAIADTELIKRTLFVPLLAREGQELVLLLPYDQGHFLRYGGSRTKPQLIEKKQLGRYFKELFLLYAADHPTRGLNAHALNRRLQSLLPSMLIFFACFFKLSLLGLALGAASFLLSDSSSKNLIALLQVLSVSLMAAIFLDFFGSKSALKNAPLVKLWLLSLLFHRSFSLSLREYVHRSMDDILTLRATLLQQVSHYFARAPIYFHAWAWLALNGILFLFLKPLLALFLLILILIACGLNVLLAQRLQTKRAEHEQDIKHLGRTLASLQASFSMAHSLRCLSPIIDRLSLDARVSREHARKELFFKLCLHQARAFVPLALSMVAASALIPLDNKALSLLLMIDAVFIGLALVELLWPGRSYSPLPERWVTEVNQLQGIFGHRVEAVDIKGRIELVNVSFSYEESPTLIFQGLSLTIMEGHCYGIVGPSGSGKSTLLRLLMGQAEADQGQVIFDGQDLRSLNLRTLRQHFGVIGQSTSLFAGSIIDNILCGRSFKPSALSHLFYSHEIYDLLLDLPMGMQTYVFKDAQNLSRVQVVLVLLARALIHQPKILFMDEITKGMPVSEQVLLKDYVRSLPMTRIIASHHDLDDLSCTAIFKLPHTGKIQERRYQ